MANSLYILGKQGLLHGSFALDVDTMKLALISSSYVPDLSIHQYYSDVNGYLIGASQTMTGVSVANGVFNSSSVTFNAVAGGSEVRYFVIYKDTGVASTSPLLVLIDTTTGVTLPFNTNGGDIVWAPDSGVNKIFRLV